MTFGKALEDTCTCKDDGTAELKQPFIYPFLDARAADTRRPMVGAIDINSETTNDGGIKVTQVMYPMEYECLGGTSSTPKPPISPLRASQQAADQGK